MVRYFALVLLTLISVPIVFCEEYVNPRLHVAAVQFSPNSSVKENAQIIIQYLDQCAKQGIRVVVFQECATTGYDKTAIANATQKQLDRAEAEIAHACEEFNIYAVVGTPYEKDGARFNTAVVFGPEGELIERYAKCQLVGGDDWAQPGEFLSVFYIDDIPCSIIICHDERYPELVRLPVLAGARLIFYVSSESDITAEHKMGPYRAQIAARAVENGVFIVHANSPAMLSHGQSRIIDPTGNIIAEASMFGDEMVDAVIDMRNADGEMAQKSLRFGPLKEWWQEAVKKVIIRPKK